MYSRLTRFLLPLAITLIVVELGGQVLSAGIARVPQATETLAAYGVAWGLVLLFVSPLTYAKALGLVLAEGPQARRTVWRFVVGLGVLLIAGLAAISLTPLSYGVIEGLHNLSGNLGDIVRTALIWLMPAPLVKGLAYYYTGLLMRHRRTDLVSYANIASIGAGILLVIILLPTPFIQAKPIWLPILATHLNMWLELGIVFWGYKHVTQTVIEEAPLPTAGLNLRGKIIVQPTETGLTTRATFAFFWPFALIVVAQEFSRPLINGFVASSSEGPEALAVLTVAYVLGQFPYRWLNDLRNLATAFQNEPNSLGYIRWFTVACGLISLAMMLVLFWTPLRDFILQQLMALEADFAAQCRVPLMLFAAFSPVVTVRAYLHGIALLTRRTQIMAISAPMRLAAIWLSLIMLSFFDWSGAVLGISALLAGFTIETITIWWGIRSSKI